MRFPEIDEGVLNLPLIRLERLLKECYKEDGKSGYDVPISVQKRWGIYLTVRGKLDIM